MTAILIILAVLFAFEAWRLWGWYPKRPKIYAVISASLLLLAWA